MFFLSFIKIAPEGFKHITNQRNSPCLTARVPIFWNYFLKWDLESSSWHSLDRYRPGVGCFTENLSAVLHHQAEHLMPRIFFKCFHQVYCLPSAVGLSQWLSWVCIFLTAITLTQVALLFCSVVHVPFW